LTAHDPRAADAGHPASPGVALLHPWGLSHIVMNFQKQFRARLNRGPIGSDPAWTRFDRFRPDLRPPRDPFWAVLKRQSLLRRCYRIW